MDYKKITGKINKDINKYGSDASIKELETFLRLAMDKYHNDKEIITDNQYDILIEYLEKKDPKNKFIKEVGAPTREDVEKIKLPYWLGSMNKMKTTNELNSYFKKYEPPYSISEKLDGISALLMFDNGKVLLATRGKGGIGQDISYLVPHLRIPKYTKKDKLAVRGELIMTKEKFEKKHKSKYPKGRSVVNSIINTKHPDINVLKDVDFVAYELIHPGNMSQTNQFSYLKELGYKLANHKVYKILTDEIMPKILLEMKKDSKYDIDGIIVTQDKLHPRVMSGNPKHSVAFKMQLEEQIKITTVEEVEWNPSKYGKLVPRVRYNTVVIGGDNYNYATAFNAKYIKDNKIGPGTKIKIIRSGDVIPYIMEIIKSTTASFPLKTTKYYWGKSGLDIYLEDVNNNKDVITKKLVNFFTTLEIPFINIGIINKLVDNDITKIKKIYNMESSDFMKIPGIQKKSADKYYFAIHSILDKPIELYLLMSASGIFGHGFGKRKLKPIVDRYPNIIDNYKNITQEDIMNIDGFADTTSSAFISKLPDFIKFLEINDFLKIEKSKNKKKGNTEGKLQGKNIVFSGFRDKELEEYISNEGGKFGNVVNSKTNLLVVNDIDGSSSKIVKAKTLDIKIVELETFRNLLKL